MSFRLIGISSHSCHHLLITLFVLFCYHHISILFLALIIICFILSLLFLGLMILHILVQRGQSYHSIHPIIWHWFRDFSLRGCLMGWGSCIHQWFERVYSFLVSFPLEFDLLMIRACAKKIKKKRKKKEKKKKKRKRKSAMTCLCMVSCSIGHLYHLLRYVYWVYLSLWVLVRFLYEFSLLKPFLSCIWSLEGSCESSMVSYASWTMVDMY